MSLPRPHPILRVIAWLFGAALLLNLILSGVGSLTRGPSGPASSTYATAPDGTAAYSDLLERSGRPVGRFRNDLATTQIPPGATVVVLDPRSSLVEPDVTALRRFVEQGGRLVIGGEPGTWLEPLMDDPPEWFRSGRASVERLIDSPETAGVERIAGDGGGVWSEPGAGLPLFGTPASAPVVVTGLGDGEIVLLADTSPLTNAYLDLADNAAFGLAVAGSPERPVIFVESIHGYRDAEGIYAVPVEWRWLIFCLVAAALVWMWSRGKKLGPPEPEARDLPPARAELIGSVAGTLGRTRDVVGVLGPLQVAARRRVAERVGFPGTPTDEDVVKGALRLGLNETEARALVETPRTDDQILFLGRAVSRLHEVAR